ncbi:sugar ABC transporter substrate-binding protein [Catenibacterium sp.]|uniref:sugar ABC transporter substrate-binding protein n=2 Tax=Catenibacterium sp. TaxID=2049022 RepID=UPI002E762EAD|nr:sugar ABC transporter substrate-binding protein [Catenibacterium sp.]MEE0490580.1 sugar ABC transporter substrate-binding protein [Catenibacterium sp.]
MDERSKKSLYIIIWLIVATLLGTVYTSYLTPQKTHLVFGATYMTMNNPFYEVINNELRKEIEQNGDELIVRNPELDTDKQNEQIEEFISKKVDGIFVNPIDSKKLPSLESARKAGIPVIAIDASVDNTDLIDCVIESDNYNAGVLCAQNMMKRMQSANIVLLKHSTVESAASRIQGFVDTIKDYPQYQIIDSAECEGQLERGMPLMQTVLKKHSNVDVVMALNDPSALGALAAIESLNRQDIIVYGVDGTPDLKSLIKQSSLIAGTAAQSPLMFGKLSAKKMYDILQRKDIPKIIEVPVTMITKDNIDSYSVKGWQ